jgi:hypothetical protein
MKMLKGEPPAPDNRGSVAMIRFFQWPSGKIVALEGLEEARKLPFVIKLDFPFQVGDSIPQMKDSLSRCGYIVVGGDHYQDACERLDLALGMLQVHTEEEQAVTAGASHNEI